MKNKNLLIPIIIIIFFIVLYTYKIDNYDLWAPDEPRYAQVAKEMILNNEYILPHLNKKVYYEKPPFFFWEIVLASKIFKRPIDAFIARIPSIIAAILILLSVYFWSKKYAGLTAGIISAFILGTTFEFIWVAQRAQIDMNLVLFTFLSGLLLFEGVNENSAIKRLNYKFAIAFIFMAIGTLIKGPVSLLSFAVFIIYTLFQKKHHKKNLLYLAKYFILYFLVVSLWLVPVLKKGGKEYYHRTILKQTTGRSINSFSHKQPIYYYLTNFPLHSMPYFIFFISFIFVLKKSNELYENEFLKFNVIWFISIFIIFSLISGKRELYLLQLYPSFSIITGYFFSQAIKNKKYLNAFKISGMILSLLLFISAITIFIFVKIKFPQYYFYSKIISIILFLFSIPIFIFALNKQIKYLFITIIIFITIIVIYAKKEIFQTINKEKSFRAIGEKARSLKNKNKKVILTDDISCGILFYSENFFETTEDNAEIIRRINTEKNQAVIMSKERFEKIKDMITNYNLIEENRKMIILEN
ncbi:MAG TPA: glycosyltransferase family 39 protein [bacterium]|nr:glycosyltransferase family 39 protein [bacterium]HOL48827.1 glycosyltransferase family 39 protein [bacterium]HPQ18929.1 glycosyltransferase family 39 protein [bacterium]